MNSFSKFSVLFLLILAQSSAMLTLENYHGAGHFFGIFFLVFATMFVRNMVRPQ